MLEIFCTLYLADHWYKEFIADDIAMMVTDVGRAVDKIQFTLNRIGYAQTHSRRASQQIKREFPTENTIYEEDEVLDLEILQPFCCLY